MSVIFAYGSETGMGASIIEEAYAVAAETLDEVEMALPVELDSLVSNNLSCSTLLVICCSSTGQGELPKNARKFVAECHQLSGVPYFMLCLGDSNYASFMGGPRALFDAFNTAGAIMTHPAIFADDNDKDAFADQTDQFIETCSSLIQAWLDKSAPGLSGPLDFCLPLTQRQMRKNEAEVAYSKVIEFISINHVKADSLKIPKLPSPPFDLAVVTETTTHVEAYTNFKHIQNGDIFDPINSAEPNLAQVAQSRKLTGSGATKTCWEVTLRIDGQLDRAVHCGDCVALFTPNHPAEVERCLVSLGMSPLTSIRVSGARKPVWLGDLVVLGDLVKFDVELRSPVTKAMLGALARGGSVDPVTASRLRQYCSREGKEYFTRLLQMQVTFIDLLVAFPDLKLDVSIFAYLRRLQRRWYSVANYVDHASPYQLFKVAFTQVEVPKDGLMTGQLADICRLLASAENKHEFTCLKLDKPFGPTWDRVLVSFRDPPPNQFRLPESISTPMLLIAAGSGIAPYIGFLEERRARRLGADSGGAFGEIELYFGCRNEDAFIYKSELEMFKADCTLSSFTVAYSQVEPKRYVQDVINGETVRRVLDADGLIYVCGDGAGMGKGVQTALSQILTPEGYVQLLKSKRIREDLWR